MQTEERNGKTEDTPLSLGRRCQPQANVTPLHTKSDLALVASAPDAVVPVSGDRHDTIVIVVAAAIAVALVGRNVRHQVWRIRVGSMWWRIRPSPGMMRSILEESISIHTCNIPVPPTLLLVVLLLLLVVMLAPPGAAEVLHGELHPLHVALFRLLRRGPVNSRLEDSVPLKRHAQRQAHATVAVWERRRELNVLQVKLGAADGGSREVIHPINIAVIANTIGANADDGAR